MAHSISIDPLALHNIEISEDHFVIRQDSTKSDKQGEKTHKKTVYCKKLREPSTHYTQICPNYRSKFSERQIRPLRTFPGKAAARYVGSDE